MDHIIILQPNKQTFDNTQIDPTRLLCNKDNEIVMHYLLECSGLESIRNPIFNCIGVAYETLPGKSFIHLDAEIKVRIIIDCLL